MGGEVLQIADNDPLIGVVRVYSHLPEEGR